MNDKLQTVIELDKKYYMNTFGDRKPVMFESGKGIELVSNDGKTYKDFMAGIAVNCLGYSNENLIDTICQQVRKVIHTSSLYYIESQAKLAEKLCECSCFDKAFFCNSGAEANEGAIKLSRKYFHNKNFQRYEIITLKNSFHGRTLATVAATGQEKYQKPYAPLMQKFIHIEANNSDELKNAITQNTGAIMIELIQGESGVKPLDKEYVREIRNICTQNDIVMIVDEIQTGIGRTGKLFCYENYDIIPDIVTLAKALAGGVPIGAVLARDKFCGFVPGDHGTTFGGNPLATSAALCVLDELINNNVLNNAKKMGEYFFRCLNNLKENKKSIKEIRGIGLMIGIEFCENVAKEYANVLFEMGYIVGTIGENVFRIVPPLVVTKNDIDSLMEAMNQTIN